MAAGSIKPSASALQAKAREAVGAVVKFIAGFALDCGLSANEMNALLREGAVQTSARGQLQNKQRRNISGIAAITGISRGEVSRILSRTPVAAAQHARKYRSPATDIIRAWHIDRRFLTPSRGPAALKLFGRGLTFESLVNRYGRGISVRAMFDELMRFGAIEVKPSGEIVPRICVLIDRGIKIDMINVLTDKSGALFSAMSKARCAEVKKTPKARSLRRKNFRRTK